MTTQPICVGDPVVITGPSAMRGQQGVIAEVTELGYLIKLPDEPRLLFFGAEALISAQAAPCPSASRSETSRSYS